MSIIQIVENKISHFESFETNSTELGQHSLFIRIVKLIYRFIRMTLSEFIEDRLFLKGMALTFATILSLVPLLAISFSMFKFFGGGTWFKDVVQPFILANLAPGSGPAVAQKLQEVVDNAGGATFGGIGVIVLLLAVYGIFAGIESIFNNIWGVKAKSTGLRRLPLYWGLVTIIPILVIGSFALTTYIKALPLVRHAVTSFSFAQSMLNRTIPWSMVVLGFFLLYRFLPNIRVRNRAAMTGAIVAGILHEMVKAGFIFYSGTLVRYDVVYGSLAIVPLSLVWINLSWFVVLLGVEVSFVYQHFAALLSSRMNITLSRRQVDTIAYQLLLQTALAFRDHRPPVTISEWNKEHNIPFDVLDDVLTRLASGGLISFGGDDGNGVILARDPEKITIIEIEELLNRESTDETQWESPDIETWQKLKSWLLKRKQASLDSAKVETLDALLTILDSRAGKA